MRITSATCILSRYNSKIAVDDKSAFYDIILFQKVYLFFKFLNNKVLLVSIISV